MPLRPTIPPVGREPGTGGMGTSLTPAMHQYFIKKLRQGNYIVTVCKAAGVNKSTYYYWIKQGAPREIYDNDGNVIGVEYPDTPYGRFAQDVEKATAEAEMFALESLTGHFDDDWRAAAEFLSRKFPDRWNPKVAVELTGRDGGPVEIEEKRESLFAKLDVLHIERDEPKGLESGSEPEDAEVVENG